MSKNKIKSIVILGRSWFRRTYGNSYYTAEIIVDGTLLHKLGPYGGYGSQYLYDSFAWLRGNGYVKDSEGKNPTIYCREKGIVLHYTSTDVKREKDL